MQNERYYNFIDVSKCLAMFFVVLMHCIMPQNSIEFRAVQVGAMAYFFFASGFVFKENYKEQNIFNYIAINIKKLLTYYFAFAGIGLIICYLFPYWYRDFSFRDLMYSILYIGQPIGMGLVWYLICLFEVRIIFFVIWKLVSRLKNKKAQVIILIVVVIILNINTRDLQYYYILTDIKHLPLKIDAAIQATSFYTLGFLFKYLNLQKYFENKTYSFLIFIFTRAIVTYIEINFMSYTNICDFYFGHSYILYFINQLIAIISFIALGMVFRDIQFLAYLGKNNLYIYLVHTNVIWGVEEIYALFTKESKYQFSDIREIIPIALIAYILSVLIAEVFMRTKDYIKEAK